MPYWKHLITASRVMTCRIVVLNENTDAKNPFTNQTDCRGRWHHGWNMRTVNASSSVAYQTLASRFNHQFEIKSGAFIRLTDEINLTPMLFDDGFGNRHP